ncbi:MAG: MFS transporter [Candidatus Nitrosocosmicus sp.]
MDKSNNNALLMKKRSPWIVLAILSSTLLAVMFAETMLLPAIPDIMKEFHMDYSTSPWIFSAYLIVAAVMTPISGKLSDIYGKKKILLVLLVIYIAGLIAGGFSNNTYFLILARIIQGVGLSSVPVAFGIVREIFPPEKLAIAIGIFGSAYSGGSVVGLLAGATIIQNLGWHVTFFTIAPVAIAVTVMINRFIAITPPAAAEKEEEKESKTQSSQLKNNKGHPSCCNEATIDIDNKTTSKSIDINGAIALSATITSFLIALTILESGSSHVGIANTLQITGLFAISIVSLVIFTFIEKRTLSPLVDLNLIKHKILLPSYIILMSIGISLFLVYPTITQLVRSPQPLGFGGDAITVANIQFPFMIIFLIVSTCSAFIISRFGSLKPMILGTIIAVIGSVSLLMFHSTGLFVSVNLGIMATGMALANTGGWNILVSSAPKESIGISVGIGALLFFIGMAIGPALAGLYMQTNQTILNGNSTSSYPSSQSYQMIFLTATLFLVISIAFATILKRRMSKQIQQQELVTNKKVSVLTDDKDSKYKKTTRSS